MVGPKRGEPLFAALPRILKGSQATDGGNLLLTSMEKEQLLLQAPESSDFIRKITGSQEYINGQERWCLWITPNQVESALLIPGIAERVEKTRLKRLASRDAGARKLAERPWMFREQREGTAIIVPSVSSERREYVPIGYLGPDTVISNLAFAIYDAEPWVFALVTSRMHMAWLRAVGGKLKTDFRYSNTLVYNTFPVPNLTAAQKETLTQRALRVLDVREYHSEKTLAELYDPDLMPDNLRLAHKELDDAVDALYRKSGFASDEDRLALLFDLYVQKTSAKESA